LLVGVAGGVGDLGADVVGQPVEAGADRRELRFERGVVEFEGDG
jgi:hypothetical protein